MISKRFFVGRAVCVLLAICLVAGGLVSCAGKESEIPEGYQYATCDGEYFRLFLPTQWTVNTESGVSCGYPYAFGGMAAVSMTEVPFESGTEELATLEEFCAAHMAEIKRLSNYSPDPNLHPDSKPVTTTWKISDSESVRTKDITYTAFVAGVKYRYSQRLCRAGGKFYIFTASYDAEYFDKHPDQQLELEGIIRDIRDYVKIPNTEYEVDKKDEKPPKADVPDGMQLVSNNDVAYRFFAPKDWIVSKGNAASLVYASEEDRSNVSVIGYVPETEGYSVEKYWEETRRHYESALTDFKLISDSSETAESGETPERQTMGGRDATVYEFTYSLGGVSYHARQVICVYSYMIVTMTYTALPENYEAHLAEAEAMQAALTFRRPIVG